MSDPATTTRTLRLGARGSLLSRLQSTQIAAALKALHPGISVELVPIRTTGDQITDQPLHTFGGKGLFTREIELALLANQIDFAVHSLKDVPITMPLVDQAGLVIAAVPEREDARDVLVSAGARKLADLPRGARVGTSSLRRQSQLLAIRPYLQTVSVRGNIDTRIGKVKAGEFDAIILARAGLLRANLFDPAIMHTFEITEMLPAAGQGALALQCRANDAPVRAILAALNHAPTALATQLEREVVRRLDGDCQSPIAAHASLEEDVLHLRVAIGKHSGGPPLLIAAAAAPLTGAPQLVDNIIAQLEKQNVRAHLHGP